MIGALLALVVICMVIISVQALNIQELKMNNGYFKYRLKMAYREVPEVYAPKPFEYCPKANDPNVDPVYASTIYPPLTAEETAAVLEAAQVQLDKINARCTDHG